MAGKFLFVNNNKEMTDVCKIAKQFALDQARHFESPLNNKKTFNAKFSVPFFSLTNEYIDLCRNAGVSDGNGAVFLKIYHVLTKQLNKEDLTKDEENVLKDIEDALKAKVTFLELYKANFNSKAFQFMFKISAVLLAATAILAAATVASGGIALIAFVVFLIIASPALILANMGIGTAAPMGAETVGLVCMNAIKVSEAASIALSYSAPVAAGTAAAAVISIGAVTLSQYAYNKYNNEKKCEAENKSESNVGLF